MKCDSKPVPIHGVDYSAGRKAAGFMLIKRPHGTTMLAREKSNCYRTGIAAC